MANYEKTGPGVTAAPAANPNIAPVYQQPQTQPQPQYAARPGPAQQVARHWTPPSGPPEEWQHGLFECLSDVPTCILGFLSPCSVYSKTHQRIRTSPSSGGNLSPLNPACVGWFCSGGASSARQRNEIRYRYNLRGDGMGDCLKHTYCSRCALIQEELEVRDRERQMVQMYNSYTAQQPMTYTTQN